MSETSTDGDKTVPAKKEKPLISLAVAERHIVRTTAPTALTIGVVSDDQVNASELRRFIPPGGGW